MEEKVQGRRSVSWKLPLPSRLLIAASGWCFFTFCYGMIWLWQRLAGLNSPWIC